MSLTLDQLLNLPLGYLQGSELAEWCSPQLLIKQYAISPASLQKGCDRSYSAVTSKLVNRYDMKREMAKIAPLPATATTNITAGAVSAITIVTAGGLYETPPTVVFTGGAGAGAAATAVIDADGKLTAINITAGGIGYTSAPAIILNGGLAPDTRESFLVQLVSTLAVRNILGSSQNVSDFMMGLFKQAEKDLLDIRNAQMNLALYPVPVQPTNPETNEPFNYPQSDAVLIPSSFNYLG